MFLPIIIKLSQRVWELWPAEDFGFRAHKFIMKKVRVVSLARDISIRLLSLSLFQPNIIKYFKPLRSYGMHENLDKKFVQGR